MPHKGRGYKIWYWVESADPPQPGHYQMHIAYKVIYSPTLALVISYRYLARKRVDRPAVVGPGIVYRRGFLMERVAIGFLCGLGILGAIAFLVILKLRDSGDRIFKTFLAVFGFLASVATIVGIAIQIWDWNGPPSQTVVPVVTVVGMRAPSDALTVPLATAVPATTTAAPNVAPPTAAPPPLLPETLAELHYYSDTWPHER